MKISKALKPQAKEYGELLAFLEGFWSAMHAWEVNCSVLDQMVDGGQLPMKEMKSQMITHLQEIFSQYCNSTKKPKRVSGGTCSFSSPPDYDPKIDKIVRIATRKSGYDIDVRNGAGFKFLYRYYIRFSEDQYKILDKRTLLDETGNVEEGL